MNVVEANGARIPAIGLGTMTLKDAVCVDAVRTALQQGYRHIDTAERYGNEAEVGEGLRQGLAAAGLGRDDVFVTTKVYWDKLAEFDRSVDESLRRLGLPWVDLLLIHWNNPKIPLEQSIASLCKAKKTGLARHVGVANFTTAMLDDAVRLSSEPLVANQIEVHPFLDQTKVIAKCREHGISVTAYCPAARGKVPGDETLTRMGRRHGKSATQVALRFLVQQDIVPIPRTAKPDHLAANLAIFDFTLGEDEMAEIGELRRPDGRLVNPPHAPQWDA